MQLEGRQSVDSLPDKAARNHSGTSLDIDLLVIIAVLAIPPTFLDTGSGLLYTLDPSTSAAQLVAFQILCGIGTTMGLQNSLLAILGVYILCALPGCDMAMFAQFFGGTIGFGVALHL
ncbi:hypothetical protein C8J57DRAFT_1528812 [Mycena rebaudengoi]|nr:hypothetical protein C8J57DRAFT_1528812 [Mycena rebaudengoi]